MTEQTIQWLRQTFGSALTIHINEETGNQFIYFREVSLLINDRPLDAHTVSWQLWSQPGSDTWIVFRDEDLPYLDQAIHDVARDMGRSQN